MPKDAIAALLHARSAAAACPDVASWWPRWQAVAAATPDPFERAIRGGGEADRLAWAFASGYQAALRALDPTLSDGVLAALCVTEAEGNFPRAIRSALSKDGDGFLLSGEKRWTTLGPGGGVFLVIAREAGSDEARPALKAVRVASSARGLAVIEMPATSFVPEVPHAQVKLDRVRVPAKDVLEGDAYINIVKPFRTIEDIHVHSAAIAYLAAEARRRGWPNDWLERALMLLHSMARIAKQDPLAFETHIALAAALRLGETLVAEADGHWAKAGNDPPAQRWARDRKLMNVASKARAQRLASAWERLAGTPRAGIG